MPNRVCFQNARRSRYEKQGGRCFWCDYPIFERKHMGWGSWPNHRSTADHLIPVSLGGGNVRENLVAACAYCNNMRGNRSISDTVDAVRRSLLSPQRQARLKKFMVWFMRFGHGHLAHASPAIENPIVRDPEIEAPAPA